MCQYIPRPAQIIRLSLWLLLVSSLESFLSIAFQSFRPSSVRLSGSPPAFWLEGRPAVARVAACNCIGLLQYGHKTTAAGLGAWAGALFHIARAARGAGCMRTKAGTARAAAILSTVDSWAAPVDCLYNVWRVMFSRSARSANVRPRALHNSFIFSFKSMWANVAYLFDFCKMGGQGASCRQGQGQGCGWSWGLVSGWISGQLSGLQIFLGL